MLSETTRWVLLYFLAGLSFALYVGRRLREDEFAELNNTVLVILVGVWTVLWPIFLVWHLYISVKRGSFKRVEPEKDKESDG